MSDEVPPAYNATSEPNVKVADPAQIDKQVDDSAPLPEYTPPTQFTIGSSKTDEPLVSILQIKGHLALLHAFAELRQRVESMEISLPNIPTEKDRKWAWFVALAVERFDCWCLNLQPGDSTTNANAIMPPVDVIMVWHSYMLNPRWYMEDTMRIPAIKLLKTLENSFKRMLEDPSSIFFEPASAERQKMWESRTLFPFDAVASMHRMTSKTLFCPSCSFPIEVDLMKVDGSGYFQQKFSATCTADNCTQVPITKEILAFQKLCRELCLTPGTGETINYLPGTLFPLSNADLEKGRRLKTAFVDNATTIAKKEFGLDLYTYGSPGYEAALTRAMMKHAQSLTSARARMSLYAGRALTSRIILAYTDDKMYSMELVGAVLRQGTFVEKMYDLGWTRPDYFHGKEDELALHHALARYHAFLDLMSSSVGSFFVPTLDIDLVWHTHQLLPRKYEADCTQYLKRFIDHDDKIEGLRLSSAFDLTCTAWKERFNVQYTYCGCPLPGDTIGQRLSRIVGRYAPPPSASHLLPADRPDFLSATHPSDHNAVRFQPASASAHKRATKRYEQLAKTKQKEREKAAKKAAKAGRAAAPHAHDERRRDDARAGTYDYYAYQTAFLVPVPLYYGPLWVGGGGCVGAAGEVNVPGGCAAVQCVAWEDARVAVEDVPQSAMDAEVEEEDVVGEDVAAEEVAEEAAEESHYSPSFPF